MYISHETPEQTEARLRQVLAMATVDWLEGAFAFHEYPAHAFPAQEAAAALAFVRDAEVWSVLAPADAAAPERFALFAVHFAHDLDNSGFVGWLASRLKASLGTGVFVVCGQNSRRGGIFDYWGVPFGLQGEVAALLEELRSGPDTRPLPPAAAAR